MTEMFRDFVKRAAEMGVGVSVRRLPEDLYGTDAARACELGFHAYPVNPVSYELANICRFCGARKK